MKSDDVIARAGLRSHIDVQLDSHIDIVFSSKALMSRLLSSSLLLERSILDLSEFSCLLYVTSCFENHSQVGTQGHEILHLN